MNSGNLPAYRVSEWRCMERMEYVNAADATFFTGRTRQRPGGDHPVISPDHKSDRNPIFYNAEILSAGIVFRRSALRA
jgi:hypothetical protein